MGQGDFFFSFFFVIVCQRFSLFYLKSNFVIPFVLQILKCIDWLVIAWDQAPHWGKMVKRTGEGEKNGVRSELNGGQRRKKATACRFSFCCCGTWFQARLVKILSRFSFLVVADFLQGKCLLDSVNNQSDSFQVTSMIYRVIHTIHHQRIEYLPGRWVVTYRSWRARKHCACFSGKKLASCLIQRNANCFVMIPESYSSESVRRETYKSPVEKKKSANKLSNMKNSRGKQPTFRGTTTGGVAECWLSSQAG